MEGDALILPDTEFPFHDADFVNHCLELAHAWGIEQAIIAGDALHFDSLSQWEANWIVISRKNTLSEDAENEMRALIQNLPPEHQGALLSKLTEITEDAGEPTELMEAKKALLTLGSAFERIDYVIGNHDDRFVRALKSPMMPQTLLDFVGLTNPRWRIGPYFYSILISGGEKFRIEHPRSAAANTATRLADKFETSVIMGHSHAQDVRWSTSGRHYAIHAGCCVDERRLPYAAQRSTNQAAHKLGAVIVREGYPYVLHDRVDWQRLARCK
jgi:predicted phosphodiesterase